MLMREKISNLCAFMAEQYPDKKLRIVELAKYEDREITEWIFKNVIPMAHDIPALVENLCKSEGITATKEIRAKLSLYCKFFYELFKTPQPI